MRTYALVPILLILLFIIPVQTIASQNLAAQQASPVKVLEKQVRADGMRFSLAVESPMWNSAGVSDQLAIAEFFNTGAIEEPGMPVVPRVGNLFRIPPNAGVVVEVLNAEYETFTDVEYAAFAGAGALDELLELTEPVDAWFPGQLAETTEPAVMRAFRVCNLVTYPVQVNPARREVRVYHNLDVDIRYEGTDNRNTIPQWPTKLSKNFLPFYRLLLDWDEDELDQYELYRGSVQLVMRNNDTIEEYMEDWIEWKMQKGWEIDVLSDDNAYMGSAYTIKEVLQTRWDNSEEKFDYIVIVGDATNYNWRVPPSEGYGDYMYACLSGDDIMIDCGIGRISVETVVELATYVNKVICYERDPYMDDDTEWYTRAQIAVASNESGIGTVYTGRYQRRIMLQAGYTQVDTAWVSPWGSGNVNNRSIQRINEGVSFYGCRGFINCGLSTEQIEDLQNDYKTPVVIDVTCYTGTWHSHYAITEAYIRAGTASIPRGGIGAMGTATGYTKPRFNNVCSGGAAYSMFVMQNRQLGDHYYASQYYMHQCFDGNDASLDNFVEWYNLMGDPTVWTWIGVPQELDVTAASSINEGTTAYEVTVRDDGGHPVKDAWVTFYKEDNNENLDFIARGETDASGYAILDTPIDEEGDAILTVTAQGYEPFRLTVNYGLQNNNVHVQNVTIFDNGQNGSSGDGDGVLDAGETVAMQVQLHNYSNTSFTNLSITADSDDAFLTPQGGTATIATLGSHSSVIAAGYLLFEVEGDARNEWVSAVMFDIDADQADIEDVRRFTLAAPDMKFMMHDAGVVDPGDTQDFALYIRNEGSDNTGNATGSLVSLNSWVTVTDPTATFQNIPVGSYSSGNFEVSVAEDAYEGFESPMMLYFETNEGFSDSVYFTIALGNPGSNDPTGPDNYGYWAFESSDTGYDLAPDFDWIEINPAAQNNDYTGTNLALSDYGDNQDDAVVVDLPFDIQYYGLSYDVMTICSNGWVAMGGQADVPVSRNYNIPSPLGPDAIVAPYWDERVLSNGGGVFHYYDEDSGRYIIEWYRVRDYLGNNPCTFEVIFYDTDSYPTATNDNQIMFQYESMNHTSGATSGTSADILWWTTGIENHTQSDGLELAFYYDGPTTMHNMGSNSAIFITTIASVYGSVAGTVYQVEDEDEVIENVELRLLPLNMLTFSDANGEYMFTNVPPGQYWIEASADCYNEATSTMIEVSAEPILVDVGMTHPELELDTDLVETVLAKNDQVTIPVSFTNTGNGTLSYNAHILFQPPDELVNGRGPVFGEGDDLDDLWECVFSKRLIPETEHFYGLTWDGSGFWVSGSNPDNANEANLLYKFDSQGALLFETEQPVPEANRSAIGFQDLTWDGEYLYGVDSGIIFQMQVNGENVEVVNSWEVPVLAARYLIYDPVGDLFWMGDVSTHVRGIARNGETAFTHTRTFAPRGGAWNPNDADGYNLMFICRDTGDSVITFVKMNPDNGNAEEVYELTEETSGFTPRGGLIEGWWNPLVWMYATIYDDADTQYLRMWSLGDNIPWITIADATGELAPDSTAEIQVSLAGAHMIDDATYTVFLQIDNNACEYTDNLVEVSLTIDDQVIDEHGVEQPLTWELANPYPNPFNAELIVPFTLPHTTNVRAAIYNVVGQQVGMLSNRQYTAGSHEIYFNAADMASGVYFIHFQAGPINQTRKVVLLK